MTNAKTSIIILTYNKLDYTKMCLESIRKHTSPTTYEFIIVDNGSSDGTVEWLSEQPDVRSILNSENLGFPAGCNQGIRLAQGDSILLLNNDTIVTPNWLENLTRCLYSSKDIGAVGAVTNNCSNYQTVPAEYDNIDEMTAFAEKFNISNPEQWEDRIKLVGFCFLLKKNVIEEVGLLDERFTPGNYEDDDYSFRVRKAGYRLILCKDTFVHHFGSVTYLDFGKRAREIHFANQNKFKEKWGFIPDYSTSIRFDLIKFIDHPIDGPLTVLEVGCACGGTLLHIKNIFKTAAVYGVEINEGAASIAKTVAQVSTQDIETEGLEYKYGTFDYIIFGDVLEHLNNPWDTLKRMRLYLKPDGKLLASIPNINHYSIFRNMLNGNWTYQGSGLLDRTHLRFFTLGEIKQTFKDAGFKYLEYTSVPALQSNEDNEFIKALSKLSSPEVSKQFEIYQYLIKAFLKIDKPERPNHNSIKEITIKKKTFVTLLPGVENVHLTKDVGMIAYIMGKHFNYDARIACYNSGGYTYLQNEVKGLTLDFLEKLTGDPEEDGKEYLIRNAEGIDILHLFHLTERTLNWVLLYKTLNPKGKVYLKLDANIGIKDITLDSDVINVLKMCDLISVETKNLSAYLNEIYPLRVEYIPNGFYDHGKRNEINFEEKENIICTVGRIGSSEKSNEVLLEAFKLASPYLPNWSLKLIGPISEDFKPHIDYFLKTNSTLWGKVIFTGEITDRELLDEEYKKAKLFCLTSKSESFGMVFVEAAKNGCYIISSNILPAWDVTDNQKYGEIFEVNDIQQLAQLLIKNCLDEEKMRKNCKPIQDFSYQNFYWVDICRKIDSFLK